VEFFEAVKANDVQKCLLMVRKNKNLTLDVDNERKTALHWACHNDCSSMVQVLIDFGASILVKDDYARRPYDAYVSSWQTKGGPINQALVKFFDQNKDANKVASPP